MTTEQPLHSSTDALGRPSGFALDDDYAVSYAYDMYGRFQSVTFSVGSGPSVAAYAYLPGSDLISGMTTSTGHAWSRSYEPHRNLITSVMNSFNGNLISTFDYANDSIGRRTARLDALPPGIVNTNVFGYNIRSEVASALMGTNTYGYVFDPIGNRIAATNNAEVTAYVANELNQYTNILCVSATPREPTHDDDGNMTFLPSTTGGGVGGEGWYLQWDGENRLIGVSSNNVLVASYMYDHQSRRVGKFSHEDAKTRSYVYDGWNLIQQLTHTQTHALTNFYTWGLDLSGSLQGAGGVSGLLAVSMERDVYFPTFDGNGNVTDYINTDGTLAAHYEYSPFGETVVQSCALAETFAFRFSTKYWENEAKLYYYGYRYYSPTLGRWVSRDPLGDETFFRHHTVGMRRSERTFWRERSLLPAYLFVQNNALPFCDPIGLDLSYSGCECCPGIDDAVRRVNDALGTGACKEWFEEHGHDYSSGNPSRSIACHGNWKIACMLGFPAWTMPGMRIGVCNSKCEELGSVALASILIHELAHHYCTIGPGREDCAMSAQDACSEALID